MQHQTQLALLRAPDPDRDGLRTRAFAEADAWQAVAAGWRQLHGDFQKLGVSFEWHDFESAHEIDWAKSFHPGSLEICLNLAGTGQVAYRGQQIDFTPLTAGFYCQGRQPLSACRQSLQRHQFITIEFSPDYLARHLAGRENGLHPLAHSLVAGQRDVTGVACSVRLTSDQQQTIASLRHPPVFAAAQELWYQGKALEIASTLLYQPPPEKELFCVRQKRLAQERVSRVVALLKKNLAEPPTLEEIGRAIGCSPFYLSRTFSKESGLTISQCLRQIRLERAAELLRSGKYNVTEAALEVGYSSLSHFSQAFHEAFGCCPGLYPLTTPTQRAASRPAES